jgi:hypothetical protein
MWEAENLRVDCLISLWSTKKQQETTKSPSGGFSFCKSIHRYNTFDDVVQNEMNYLGGLNLPDPH